MNDHDDPMPETSDAYQLLLTLKRHSSIIGRAVIGSVWAAYFLFCCVFILITLTAGRGAQSPLEGAAAGIGAGIGSFFWIIVGYCMTRAVDRVLRAAFAL